MIPHWKEVSDPAVIADKPLVSVAMITYNHEPFIAQAIEGVVMQKTNFPIELVIGEDKSTDRTREIVLEYQRRHPSLVRVIVSDANVGMYANFFRSLSVCRGKYIALCEGDDYWIASDKLEKQVAILEKDLGVAGTFHDCVNLDLTTGTKTASIVGDGFDPNPDVASLLRKKNMRTCSKVFRNRGDWSELMSLCSGVLLCDYMLALYVAERGRWRYLDEVMGVKNMHPGGVWSGLDSAQQQLVVWNLFQHLLRLDRYPSLRNVVVARKRDVARRVACAYSREGHFLKSVYYFLLSIGDKRALRGSHLRCLQYLRVFARALINRWKQVSVVGGWFA